MTAICRPATGGGRFFSPPVASWSDVCVFLRVWFEWRGGAIPGCHARNSTDWNSGQVFDFVEFGRLPKWPTGADCKSAGLRLLWFESRTYHHFISSNRIKVFASLKPRQSKSHNVKS